MYSYTLHVFILYVIIFHDMYEYDRCHGVSGGVLLQEVLPARGGQRAPDLRRSGDPERLGHRQRERPHPDPEHLDLPAGETPEEETPGGGHQEVRRVRVISVEVIEKSRVTRVEVIEKSRVIGVEVIEKSQVIGVELIYKSQVTGVEVTEKSQVIGVELIDKSRVLGVEVIEKSQVTGVKVTSHWC